MKCIKDAKLEDKTVFLRVDWNVPLKDGEIANDNRIRATIPTIEYLQSKNCKIIIGTHLGRPDGEAVQSLSTKILAKRFSQLHSGKVIATDYVIESAVKAQVEKLEPKDILVLGNLRWYKEEEENNLSFTKILASYADIYINDAFAVSHRAHASIEGITNFLPSYAGLLLEKEIRMLSTLSQNPRHPFIIVLGGAKIKDKLGLIKQFAGPADNILVGGAIANTLRFYRGDDIGKNSKIENDIESNVEEIFKISGEKMILPIDGKIKDQNTLDIGPKTIEKFKEIIAGAKTIFWNGNMGFSEDENYQTGTMKIAEAIRANQYTKIVAGGDTVGFLDSHKMLDKFTFVSTGGGAALEFLAGIELPGLKVLGYYNTNG
ncbi:MAG: phosphoglycerate kinase [Candidatus Berkelbacteria bacterium]|nr:phosphoglycerate kinase [Candidatus Berkelbacteria bacterium]